MYNIRAIIAGVLLILWAHPAAAQYVVTEQSTVLYSQSIGRITWMSPRDLEAIFAVPHFTAGPRIKCVSKAHTCDIEVASRDISVRSEERLSQLRAAAMPLLQYTVDKTLTPFTHGEDKSVVYITVRNARSSRYQTLGYALKGPAVIKFQAFTNTPADLVPILELVRSAKAIDALESWALRFGDYKAACEDRFPQYRAANQDAFLASPFASVNVARFIMKMDSSLTEDKVQASLDATRTSFARNLDRESQEKKQAFCEGFPQWISDAAKDLPSK
jgi:hypothetical protein